MNIFYLRSPASKPTNRHSTLALYRTRAGLWSASLLTGLVGIVNLLSAVTPSLQTRVHWLAQLFPFEVRATGHLFAALSGFFLLTLAVNLLRRKRVAWILTLGLLGISIVSHLVKGLDYEECLLSGVLLVQLLLMRTLFTAQSDRPSVAQGVRVLVGALLFTLAYGSAGFYLLDQHYSRNFDLWEAINQTLAMFFTEDNAGLQSVTRFAQFFANSVEVIGATTVGYAVLMILRPVLLRGTATATERQRAKALAEQFGHSSLAHLTLLHDKLYHFSPSGRSVIAYVAKGRGAIALGDPIGAPEDRQEVILSFQQLCARNDWYPAFYQTLPENLSLYQSLGFHSVKIGEEAIVDLQEFTLEGKAGRNLRNALNRMTKQGYRVQFWQPPIAPELLKQLKAVSDEWLHAVQGSEKKFALGWFDEAYLRECEIAAVYTPQGQISAFANIIPEYQLNEITIDLMRRRTEVDNGTMDFLFISMLQHFKQAGYASFNFGLSALSGVGVDANAPRLEKSISYLYKHLSRFYNFEGLHGYKEKFHPHWEPRYFVYPNLATLPEVVLALVRADSGDRLLDYLKPGS